MGLCGLAMTLDLPTSDERLRAWLLDRFVEWKDGDVGVLMSQPVDSQLTLNRMFNFVKTGELAVAPPEPNEDE